MIQVTVSGSIRGQKLEKANKKLHLQTLAKEGSRIQLVLCLEKKIMESGVKEKLCNSVGKSVCTSLW